MPVLEGFTNMYDIAARLKLSGDSDAQLQGRMLELQAQTNDIWRILHMQACNDGTGEKVAVRESLPTMAWRMINRGVKPTKTSSGTVRYTTGGIEDYSDVDERILKLYKDAGAKDAYRMTEIKGKQMAATNQMAQTIFYGDEKTNPAGFTGLSAHYNKIQGAKGLWKEQIVDAGGTGENLTSIWFIASSSETVYGIYPTGSTGGYHYQDNGRVKVEDGEHGHFWAYEGQINWDMGIAIRDPRYVVRLCNVDVTKFDDAQFKLKLIDAFDRIYDNRYPISVLCNRQAQTYLDQMAAQGTNAFTSADFYGQKITHYWGAPILRNDGITCKEKQIV